MIDELLGWMMLGLAGIATVLGLWSIYTMPSGSRRRCPGRRASWMSWFDLLGWFKRGNCWHDLTGLYPDKDGSFRCPECGKTTASKKVLRDGRRFRAGILSTGIGLLAISAGVASWSRSGVWCRPIPTLPLVMLSNTSEAGHRTAIRKELAYRVKNGDVTGYSARMLAGTLVIDLRDDNKSWNANEAWIQLYDMWPDSQATLERELTEGDAQSRPIAAGLLRNLSSIPSMALLAQSIDELGYDTDHPGWWLRGYNARAAGKYLVDWQPYCRDMLHVAMESNDIQQRLLSAAVCGYAGDTAAISLAVPILTEHLKDNQISGDGKIAAPALFGFGPEVIPSLRPYADAEDQQLRESILSIIERLEHPARSWDACEHRMPRLTHVHKDPLSITFDAAWDRNRQDLK